jgi:S-adenosylmethionine hydrolase
MDNEAPRTPIITLTTDFGTTDPYVGIMKGVILGIAPDARIVDLNHGIAAGDIGAAAFSLFRSTPYFPEGTIHVVVVDPGVGSSRRSLAVELDRCVLVAPDNGVVTMAMKHGPVRRIVSLEDRAYWLDAVSRTFHGRDVFAPVAAHLCRGVEIGRLGPEIDDPVAWEISEPQRVEADEWAARVIYVDRFGNCITDISEAMVSGASRVQLLVGGTWVQALSESYAAVPDGSVLALVGSSGFVEISVRNGSAADAMALGVGAPVTCRLSPRNGQPCS